MKTRLYLVYASLSCLLLGAVLILHFRIRWLPLLCVLLGLLLRIVLKSRALIGFTFLIPLLPALGTLENRGFPLNYLALPLFCLAGVALGEWTAGKRRGVSPWPELPKYYFSFLLFLGLSFVFVMIRWSNLTLSPLAFFKDTPVAPNGQRLSFGIIFPVLELALFAFSPLYFFMLRRLSDTRGILMGFLSGQSVSVLYFVAHRLWADNANPFSQRGLSSDPTSFGFLSSLALLLAWYLFHRHGQKAWGSAFAVLALVGILNSAIRIGFLAVALAVILFILSSRKKLRAALTVGSLLAGILLVYFVFFHKPGYNIVTRLKNSFLWAEKFVEQGRLDKTRFGWLTAERNILWTYSWECVRDFPVTGVGTGNFVFWVMAKHPDKYIHHLPANQYFSLAVSSGLPGLALFLGFCGTLLALKKWPERALLGAMLFFFLINDYLWFPSIGLVFWLICSLGLPAEEKPPSTKIPAKICLAGGLLACVFFNGRALERLHPATWAKAASAPYDYGLYYKETDTGGPFYWTKDKAGIFLALDSDGRHDKLRLSCGAPLNRFQDRLQVVDIYWRGRFHDKVVFRDNGEYPVLIEDRKARAGLLELRVRPVFNLSRMGLGPETRTLGVRVLGEMRP